MCSLSLFFNFVNSYDRTLPSSMVKFSLFFFKSWMVFFRVSIYLFCWSIVVFFCSIVLLIAAYDVPILSLFPIVCSFSLSYIFALLLLLARLSLLFIENSLLLNGSYYLDLFGMNCLEGSWIFPLISQRTLSLC
jgi:hypothetical protein